MMPPEAAVAAGALQVLLIEDNDDDALLVSRQLTRDAFVVAHARTLSEAFADADRPACVLLDLSLPDADGLEAVDRVQRRWPDVPVVVLTGSADETLGLRAVTSGVQDYLVKGTSSAELLQRSIRYAVERKRTETALAEVRERFRRAFEDGPLGIALIEPGAGGGHRIIDSNHKLAAILGRSSDELLGKDFVDFAHWEERGAHVQALESVLTGAERYPNAERRMIHAEGHVVWCTVTASAVRGPGAEILYGLVLVDDVTERKLQDEALHEAHMALDAAVLGIALVGLGGRCRTANASYAATLGYTTAQLVGMHWHATVHPEDHPRMSEAIRRVLAGQQVSIEVRGVRRDRSTFDKEVMLVPNIGSDGALRGYFHFMRDVTERVAARRALERSEARYRRIVETADEGVWTIDEHGRTTFVNARMAEMLGLRPDDVLGRPVSEFLLDDHASRNGIRPGRREHRFRHSDGSVLVASVAGAQLMEGDRFAGTLAMVSDITERKAAEAELTRLAVEDQLTGLANRARLEDRLLHAARSTEPGMLAGVLFLDLDRFKTVNDGFGHAVGDELLQALAARLIGAVGPTDTLARFGGDEFVILATDIGNERELVALAERVLAAVSGPLELSVGWVTMSASIGIAACPPADGDVGTLLRDADIAMYSAKEAGGACFRVFDASMHAKLLDDLQLERDLREAIGTEALTLHYQPIVRLPDEHVAGFEALVRWDHPERGPVSPADFIPIAERTGLIVGLGEWVLREACRQLAEWTADEDHEWARVAVNVSARQIDQPGFTSIVAGALRSTGVAAHRLDLEITETALFSQERAVTVATLSRLAHLGVDVILDDFGTGYSSLSHISQYPLAGMKLDRTFVGDADSSKKRSIIEAVTAMAQALGLTLVGEGVETVEQATLLTSLGCDFAQGYMFARPMPAEDVVPWLGARRAHLPDVAPTPTGDSTAGWMTLGDAAAAVGVSASTLRRWAEEGRIHAPRAQNGHRRFRVADLKRLAPDSVPPRLSFRARPKHPRPDLAAWLDSRGERLIRTVADCLYDEPTTGWFGSERARRPLRLWIDEVARACRCGDYNQLTQATITLGQHAEVAGASLLESSLFVERFTVALLRVFPSAESGQDVELLRIVATIRLSVVAGR